MPNDADLARRLSAGNLWWRADLDWEREDPDLQEAAKAPFTYEAGVLESIELGGLYLLLGPRRAGKSVEIKKQIARLIAAGVNPRRIIHFSCDGLSANDVHRLIRVGRDQSTAMVDEPRYWFLDEITGADSKWPGSIKNLRETPGGFKDDCVVLTGSSMRDLNAARKALAGRSGRIDDREKYLFPLSFRQFARVLGRTGIPDVAVIPARLWHSDEAKRTVQELLPWLDELVNLWEIYCTVGGHPRAIADYLDTGAVSSSFAQDLWDVIFGEAQKRTTTTVTGTQIDLLLSGITSRLTQPMNLTALAGEVGYGSHHTAAARIDALDSAYLTWRCHPSRDGRLRPIDGSQFKSYYTDPLLARLSSIKTGSGFPPDVSVISEQQLGHFLLRQREREQMGAVTSFTELLSYQTPSEKEIDFVSNWMDGIAFESKYVDDPADRDRQTLQSQLDAQVFKAGLLMTRAGVALDGDIWAVPAGILAWALLP